MHEPLSAPARAHIHARAVQPQWLPVRSNVLLDSIVHFI